MLDMGSFEFKNYIQGRLYLKNSSKNTYAEEIHESKEVCTSTKLVRVILDAKYEKSDLNKFMKNQCQHLTEAQHNELLIILQK